MQSDGGKLKTWLKVADGPGVKDHNIELSLLATICQSIQSIFDDIGEAKYGDEYNKEDFRLTIGEIWKGSVDLPIAPSTYAPRLFDGELDPFSTVTGSFERLMFTYNTRPEQFQSQLEEEIGDLSHRIGFLEHVQRISDTGALVSIKNSVDQPTETISFPEKDSKLLDGLLTEYKEKGEETIQGIIVKFSGDKKDYFFSIRTKNGRLVKCIYNPKDEDKVQSLYKKWVSVTGRIISSTKSYKISNISELCEQESESLSVIGDYVLQKPITFKTSYDNEDGLWGMVNEELALYGYGENYNKTLRSLEDQLEGHVLSFTEYSDEYHSETSLKLKKLLSEHIDIKEAGKQMNEKYEEY